MPSLLYTLNRHGKQQQLCSLKCFEQCTRGQVRRGGKGIYEGRGVLLAQLVEKQALQLGVVTQLGNLYQDISFST